MWNAPLMLCTMYLLFSITYKLIKRESVTMIDCMNMRTLKDNKRCCLPEHIPDHNCKSVYRGATILAHARTKLNSFETMEKKQAPMKAPGKNLY